jgi:hypothetical protein
MNFNRRDFLKAGAAVSLAAGLPRQALAQAFAPQPGAWRNFQVVTRLEVANAKGKTQAWIPVPSVNEKDWFKSSASQWTTNGKAALKRDPKYAAGLVHVEWADGQAAPAIEVTSNIKVRDRAVDLSKPGKVEALSAAERKLYLGASDLIPTGGIVKETADKITKGAKTDLEKARAIYEWVVENTFRDAKVRGCGIGDSPRCSRPETWAASALTSTRSMSALRAQRGCLPATSTACGWRHQSLVTRASAPAQR